MKIAIDARMIKMSGIGTYIQNLIKNDLYQIAIGNMNDIRKYSDINSEKIIEFNEKIYGIKEQLKFPYKKIKRMKPDILHVPHYNVPLFYRGKMIVTIHDLTHLVFPQFLPNKIAYLYAKMMIKMAVKKSCKIITDSENTKKDILERFKVNPNKIVVNYIGVSEMFCHKDSTELCYLYDKFLIPKQKKILMYVGNMKPHKNLSRLLEAFSKICNIDDFRLVLVGKAFEKQIDLEEIEKNLSIEKYVIHTGIVSQNELVDLYNISNLFIFPSLYEGFGLPVIEALACGTNVICSNNSSLPEVGGEVVTYFDPYNIDDIKNKIVENVDKKFDSKKVNAWLEQFNWKESIDRLSKIFEEELNDKK